MANGSASKNSPKMSFRIFIYLGAAFTSEQKIFTAKITLAKNKRIKKKRNKAKLRQKKKNKNKLHERLCPHVVPGNSQTRALKGYCPPDHTGITEWLCIQLPFIGERSLPTTETITS